MLLHLTGHHDWLGLSKVGRSLRSHQDRRRRAALERRVDESAGVGLCICDDEERERATVKGCSGIDHDQAVISW